MPISEQIRLTFGQTGWEDGNRAVAVSSILSKCPFCFVMENPASSGPKRENRGQFGVSRRGTVGTAARFRRQAALEAENQKTNRKEPDSRFRSSPYRRQKSVSAMRFCDGFEYPLSRPLSGFERPLREGIGPPEEHLGKRFGNKKREAVPDFTPNTASLFSYPRLTKQF